MLTRRQILHSATGAMLVAAPAQVHARPIKLFNGRDLTNFYTFLRTKGKNVDPDKVFTVVNGAIRVSGTEFGQFMTNDEFENYRLVVEFKWGAETHAPRKDRARDSGILYHCVGPDKVWHRSVEYQIIEGGTGDIILVDGASMDFDPAHTPRYAGARLSPFGTRLLGGRVNWHKRAADWKDVIDFRGKDDVEKPVGQWNRVEVVADGADFVHLLNGVDVNRGTGADPRKGKILFQSEGAELFFKTIELHPLR